jgi:sugar lactone lactonase YvrE
VVVSLVLLALLLGLGVVYYLLSRPPQLATQSGTKDRHYLFSIYGFQGDLLRRPTGVAFDEQGNIYVADTGKKRVVIFDSAGNYVTTYGDAGDQPTQLWEPIGIAVNTDGRSYVLDKGKKKIVIFDAQHRPQKVMKFDDYPLAVTIARNRLYVAMVAGIVEFDLDGNKAITGYLGRGQNPGQFDTPGGVAVGADGTIYVADSLNYRIQAIKDGKPLWQYGKPIPPGQAVMYNGADRKFGLPSSIAADENGYLYVVDGLSSELIVLDTKGQFVERVGDVGHDDGTFYYPDGIAYKGGRLAIADKFNDRVEVFSVPTAAAAWRSYIPYGLLLLLLPLLALLFRRTGVKYVASPEFVERLGEDENRETIAAAIKRLNVSPAVAEAGRALSGMKLDWVERQVPDEDVRALAERFELGEGAARALAVAADLRGKRVLLTDDAALRDAAQELNVPTVGYAEILDTLGVASEEGGQA